MGMQALHAPAGPAHSSSGAGAVVSGRDEGFPLGGISEVGIRHAVRRDRRFGLTHAT